jgi:hypothetical protein
VFLLPSIALIMAAMLLYSGISLLQEAKYPAAEAGAGSQPTHNDHGWMAKVSLVMRWLVAGLLLLAGILVPIIVLLDNFENPGGLFGNIFQVGVTLLPFLALIMAAVLLYADNDLKGAAKTIDAAAHPASLTTPKNQGKLALACFVLSGVLVLKTLQNLYWLTVWDNTTDSLGYIWIALPVLMAFFSGFLLFFNLRRQAVWVGLGYLVLIPGLLVAVSTRAQQVDYRQLTESNAERVSQRVEAFYARQGRYPQELRQVKSWYAASLPDPFIMYGQDWCYLAGEDYYQLGYVDREHWSSPELIRRLYKSSGEAPETEAICAEEISALIQQESIYYEK